MNRTSPTDSTALRALLGRPYGEAERSFRLGYVSEQDWRWYVLLWTWSAPRFGGAAGRAHDRAWRALGAARYQRRIERVNALMRRLGLLEAAPSPLDVRAQPFA